MGGITGEDRSTRQRHEAEQRLDADTLTREEVQVERREEDRRGKEGNTLEGGTGKQNMTHEVTFSK